MNSLPQAPNLPIQHLAASFDDVTNSYKYYWLLAILEHVRENQSRIIATDDLLARMLASIWYPTNYFRLSFGKQDRLGQIAIKIGAHAGLPMDAKRYQVIQVAKQKVVESSPLADEIRSLAAYVPYRFLRPFFAEQLRGEKDYVINGRILQMASEAFSSADAPPIYRFIADPFVGIELHPDWFAYLNRHLTVLTGFCLWHLVNYVQKNNPNTPNIPNKLFEPGQRDLHQARQFWRSVFSSTHEITCIYSGQPIQTDAFSLDHFLPWRFVAHDLLWNIVPAPRNVNSAKNDNLPDLERYFEPFATLQYNAVKIVTSMKKAALLEDHILLFRVSSTDELSSLSFHDFQQKLHDAIAPQFQIATNMGFSSNWSYV